MHREIDQMYFKICLKSKHFPPFKVFKKIRFDHIKRESLDITYIREVGT